MKKFCWLPKVVLVEIKQDYWDGAFPPDEDGMVSATWIGNPRYFWVGYEYKKWLWFDYKKQIYENKEFEVYKDNLHIIKHYPHGVLFKIKYHQDEVLNRKQRRMLKRK